MNETVEVGDRVVLLNYLYRGITGVAVAYDEEVDVFLVDFGGWITPIEPEYLCKLK